MLQIGTKAPEFSLPDENGTVETFQIMKVRNLYYTFIQRIILRVVQARPVALENFIRSLRKKE